MFNPCMTYLNVGQGFLMYRHSNYNAAEVQMESLIQVVFCALKGPLVDDHVGLYY